MNLEKKSRLSFGKRLNILKTMVRNQAFEKRFERNSYLGINEPGIFRRSASVALIKLVQQKYNEGSLEK
jgi:hypothetical protein